MTRKPLTHFARCAKGALAVLAATAACHTLMTAGYAWAREANSADGDAVFSGAIEFLLTTAASWALMPILLWAGMRLLREAGNTVLVLAGGTTWFFVSGYFIDDIDSAGGHMPFAALAAYVLFGTALSGISTSNDRSRPAAGHA